MNDHINENLTLATPPWHSRTMKLRGRNRLGMPEHLTLPANDEPRLEWASHVFHDLSAADQTTVIERSIRSKLATLLVWQVEGYDASTPVVRGLIESIERLRKDWGLFDVSLSLTDEIRLLREELVQRRDGLRYLKLVKADAQQIAIATRAVADLESALSRRLHQRGG